MEGEGVYFVEFRSLLGKLVGTYSNFKLCNEYNSYLWSHTHHNLVAKLKDLLVQQVNHVASKVFDTLGIKDLYKV